MSLYERVNLEHSQQNLVKIVDNCNVSVSWKGRKFSHIGIKDSFSMNELIGLVSHQWSEKHPGIPIHHDVLEALDRLDVKAEAKLQESNLFVRFLTAVHRFFSKGRDSVLHDNIKLSPIEQFKEKVQHYSNEKKVEAYCDYLEAFHLKYRPYLTDEEFDRNFRTATFELDDVSKSDLIALVRQRKNNADPESSPRMHQALSAILDMLGGKDIRGEPLI